MGFRPLALATLLLVGLAAPASAQDAVVTEDVVNKLLAGIAAEKPELDKVADQIAELDEKIEDFRTCYEEMRIAAEAAGRDLGGLSGRVAVRAKCGASNDEGMLEDRAELLENPERVGARAAGMNVRDYVRNKELATMYLDGSRSFPPASLTVLAARATDLSNALGIPIADVRAGNDSGGGGGRSGGGGLGGAMAMRMFTPDMTWAYVGYLWGIMYMSGATMFETAYQPGQWTNWEITDESQPDQKLILERALIRREADRSEWWRIKTVTVSAESADTIILESQFKPMDEQGLMMQVVRMRGKMPGDTEGKELIVPQQFSMLGAMAFPFKPTPESVAGATIGTESIRGFSSRHVKFGAGQGSMEWWLADDAPGGVVKVQFTGQEADEKWIMDMTGSGNGATSELGI